MAYLDDFSKKEAYSNQVEIPGIASVIHENPISQATWGNHCELSATTILAVYNDVTNSKGMLRIGTRVSDFAIEWGTAVEFNSGAVANIIPVRVSDTKFLIVYRNVADSYGFSIGGTVVGTVPTLGTRLVFFSGGTTPIGAVLMDTDKVMIAFDNDTANGRCVMASLTGTSIAYGAVAIFVATTNISGYITLTQLCKHSATLASVVYRVSATVTEVVTLSLSGTTITPNTAGKAAFGGSADIRYPSIGALDANMFVLAYTDATDTNKGNVQTGYITGTTIATYSGEYNFDSANVASRFQCVTIISSTLFVIGFSNPSNNFKAIVGSVSTTSITLGTELAIASGSSPTSYIYNSIYTRPCITYTKSGQLTFSYLAYYLNQFVCGMLSQNYRTLEIVPMCVKVAEALTGEQIELSSIYLKSNNNGFKYDYTAPTLDNDLTGSIYHNGTLASNKFYSTNNMALNVTNSLIAPLESRRIGMANEPIILKEGQALYASIDTNQGTSPKKGSVTCFGLKRSVA